MKHGPTRRFLLWTPLIIVAIGLATDDDYRVIVSDAPSVVSPVLTLNVTVVVGTKTTRTHVHRGGRVHFSGTIKPNVANVPVAMPRMNALAGHSPCSSSARLTGGNK